MLTASVRGEWPGRYFIQINRYGFPILYLHKNGKISQYFHTGGSGELTRTNSRREAIGLMKSNLRIIKKIPSSDSWDVKVNPLRHPFLWIMDSLNSFFDLVCEFCSLTKKALKCLKQTYKNNM